MIRYIVILLLSLNIVYADKIQWSHNYEDALSISKKVHKPVYLFITTPGCQWCNKFETTTLTDPKTIKYIANNFVALHLVASRDTIPEKFAQFAFPRHYFLDQQGNIIFKALGYRDAELFISIAQTALQRYVKKNKEKK